MLEVLRRRFTASNTDGPVTESTQHPRALFNGSTEDWIPHRYEGSSAARTAEPERLKAEPVERRLSPRATCFMEEKERGGRLS